jgi:low affinity Fe/Cu permease
MRDEGLQPERRFADAVPSTAQAGLQVQTRLRGGLPSRPERHASAGTWALATRWLTMQEQRSPLDFSEVARQASNKLGTPYSFAIACGVVLLWAVTGPLFGYSDTWQLVINTGTTIVTFLMVFLVQHTQNRDARALHLKLDEMLRSIGAARNKLIDLENCTDEELDQMERQFKALRAREDRKVKTH